MRRWNPVLRAVSCGSRRRRKGCIPFSRRSGFLRDFEDLLLEYGTDYRQVDHKRVDAYVIGRFLGHEQVRREVFPNRQTFDHEGLTGRLLSSSYVPEAPEPGHPEMMQRLREIFEIHAKNGAVEVLYDTIVYCGRLHGIGHGS